MWRMKLNWEMDMIKLKYDHYHIDRSKSIVEYVLIVFFFSRIKFFYVIKSDK